MFGVPGVATGRWQGVTSESEPVELNPTEAVKTAEAETCNPGEGLCGAVLEMTGSRHVATFTEGIVTWLQDISGLLIQATVTIVIGWLVGLLVRSYINRITENIATGKGALGRAVTHPAMVPGVEEVDPHRGERRAQRARAVGQLLRNAASILVFVVVAINLIYIFGLSARFAPLFASAGIAGIALGFGAQSLVRDFLSGIFMIIEDQYGVGDIIDVGEATGTVEMVGLRITRLRDIEGVVWYIRNGELLRVGNKSQGWARAVLDIGVAYDCDLAYAKDVMREVGQNLAQEPGWAELMLEKPDVWGVESLGDNSVVLRLVVKTQPLEQWKVSRELRGRIKERFAAEGIEIPFPQQTVWLQQSDDAAGGNPTAAAAPATAPSPAPAAAPGSGATKQPSPPSPPGRGESEALAAEDTTDDDAADPSDGAAAKRLSDDG